jgi:hypothetical protein
MGGGSQQNLPIEPSVWVAGLGAAAATRAAAKRVNNTTLRMVFSLRKYPQRELFHFDVLMQAHN